MRFAFALCVLALVASAQAQAQSPLVPPVNRGLSLQAEVSRIGWDDGAGGDVGGVVGFVGVHVPISSRAAIVADLPVARVQIDGAILPTACVSNCSAPAQGAEAFVGNPYVGMRTGQPGDPFSGEVGLRLPVLAFSGYDDVERLGVVSVTAFDRFEAFGTRDLTLVAMGGLAHAVTDWLVLRGRGGFAAQLGEATGAAVLEGAVAWRHRSFRVAATGLTRFDVSDGQDSLGERTGALVGFEATATLGRVRPGLTVRVPVGDVFPDAAAPTVGLSLSLAL